MLAIGVNHSKEDFNRMIVYVHHLTDDVTGEPLPICGTDIENLMGGGPADGLLEDIKRGRDPLFSDDSSRMCERCRAIYLAPGTEEQKSRRRLKRWEGRQARRRLVKEYERRIAEQRLACCPRCQQAMELQTAGGYSSADATCSSCGLEWAFLVSVSHDGSFVVWADDASEKFSGRAEGHVNIEDLEWGWG
jgi:transcription elongation factor Elf1